MYKSSTQIRVRYAETDQMSVVYYGNYATYYEVARTEAIRQLGLEYAKLEEEGIIMPVVNLNCNYHASAKYDDLLTVTVMIKSLPTAKMVFDYEIKNEKTVCTNTGSTTLVFVSTKTMRPVQAPEQLISVMKPLFE